MTREEVNKLLPFIQAFSEGKTIQSKCITDDIPLWWDDNNPTFDVNTFDYRIKPDPKYRPFKNAQECIEEMQKHQPFGWIKCKGCCFNIVYVNNVYVGLADPFASSISLSSKNSYLDNTFLDGEPFGINIEEE